MKCQHVEELLPLYVEGDLNAETMHSVSTHLGECEHCATLAEEFTASQTGLHEHNLPNFDERFFTDLKSNVMREINQQAPQISFRQWLFPGLYLKPVWATAFVLMIAVGLVIYFYQHKATNDTPQISANSQEAHPASDLPNTSDSKKQNMTVVKPVNNPTTRNPHRPRFRAHPQLEKQPARKAPQMTEPTYIADNNPSTNLSEMTENTTAPEMTRIEFQTNDPKIRIIWFVPKTTETPKIDTE